MKKELYIKHLTDNINQNIDKYFTYIDSQELYVLCSLKILINENINCLILNNYIASICVTNHLFERFIKLSIIEYGTSGFDISNDELYNAKVLESYDFDDKVLNKTLKKLKEVELITDSEYNDLNGFRETYRNAYSHSDTKSIVKDVPDTFSGKLYSIDNLADIISKKEISSIPYEEKTISTLSPAIAQMYIQDHAIKNAFNYFKGVFDIILNVDNRLQELNINK